MTVTYSMKVVLLGEQAAGKTSLAQRFLFDRFLDAYQPTIEPVLGQRLVQVDGNHLVQVKLWDTSGSERLRSVCYNYYRGADAVVLCADVTKPTQFSSTAYWRSLVEFERQCRVYICGTKKDLMRSREANSMRFFVQQASDKLRAADVVLTSSKKGENVQHLFEHIAAEFVESRRVEMLEHRRRDQFVRVYHDS